MRVHARDVMALRRNGRGERLKDKVSSNHDDALSLSLSMMK